MSQSVEAMFSQYVTNILDWLLLLDHLINCIDCFEGLKVTKVHVLHQKQKYFYGGTALFKLCTIRIPFVNTKYNAMLRFVVPTIAKQDFIHLLPTAYFHKPVHLR